MIDANQTPSLDEQIKYRGKEKRKGGAREVEYDLVLKKEENLTQSIAQYVIPFPFRWFLVGLE